MGELNQSRSRISVQDFLSILQVSDFCWIFVEGLSFGKYLVACYAIPSFFLYKTIKYLHCPEVQFFEYLIRL